MLLSYLLNQDMTTVIIAFVVALVAYLFMDSFKSKPRLPPQPGIALPVIGHLYKFNSDPVPLLQQWRKKYGDVFSFYIGSRPAVVLNGYNTIYACIVKRSDEFSDRHRIFLDEATGTPGKGVAGSSGAHWKEQRSTLLTILRRLGMGKNVMEQKITEEFLLVAESLEALNGKPSNVRMLLTMAVSNVICSNLIGKRFDYEDKMFQSIVKNIHNCLENLDMTGMLNVYPNLKYLPGDPFRGKIVEQSIKIFIESFSLNYVQNIMSKNSENACNEPENIIEAYIHKMNTKKKAGLSTHLDEEGLVCSVFDLFLGGTETTSTSITWCLIFLIRDPRVQEKIYEEIEREIGTVRVPTVQDKVKLVYLNAVIMETLRLGNISPLGAPYSNNADTTINGYDIPKNSYIISNLTSVHMDPEIWGPDAEYFRPERFIGENGSLIQRKELIPFSLGRRVCLGEALATMELYLGLAIILQRFKVLAADESNPPSIERVPGAVYYPLPAEMRFIKRVNE